MIGDLLVRVLLRPVWRWLDDTASRNSRLAKGWQSVKWRLRYLSRSRRNRVPEFETLLSQPHRPILCEAVATWGKPASILEVGCGRGANLFLVWKTHPAVEAIGTDISGRALETARRELSSRGLTRLRLEWAEATDLSAFPDRSVDVLLSDAVFMYVSPSEIGRALDEMLRVARSGIVIGAWHEDRPEKEPSSTYDTGTWIHDFRRLLRERGIGQVQVTPYPPGTWADPHWTAFGSIITATRVLDPHSEGPTATPASG